MATKKNGTATRGTNKQTNLQLPAFMKGQLEEAQKRFTQLEAEAQKVLENLVERGQKSRKEVETLIQKFNGLDLEHLRELNPLDTASVKKFSKKANQARNDLVKRIETLQNKAVQAAGVASQAQVREITRELSRLTKKVDQLVPKRGSASKSA